MQLKGIMALVQRHAQTLRDFCSVPYVTRHDVEVTSLNIDEDQHNIKVTQHDLVTTPWELETPSAAAAAQSRCAGGGNARIRTIVVQLLKFDRSMSWMVFHHQSEAVITAVKQLRPCIYR
jgi:hypothetical protein